MGISDLVNCEKSKGRENNNLKINVEHIMSLNYENKLYAIIKFSKNVTVRIKARILPHPQSPDLLNLPLVALTSCHREETRDC